MAVAESLVGASQAASSQELAQSWRRLTRAATAVAVLTSPALFVWFTQQNGWRWWTSLLATAGVVIAFRGLVDLGFRRLIPWPSLFGAESEQLRGEDIMGRRRAWYWYKKARLGAFLLVLMTVIWLVRTAKGNADATWLGSWSFIFGGLGNVLSSPTLWIQVVFVSFLFIANFGILMGPMLLMGISQIRGYEPGDAEWGVRLADVRGQAEAKEEVRRVVTIWQSGEAFERAGGKRERGLLFLGAPGTGKTMLAKAIATGFNSPFVSIPGSGFAQTFIGIDAIIVRFLAAKAKRLARKWGGQCIVFIDEIDAVGMRRQALQGGEHMTPGFTPQSVHDHLFFGPNGALNPSGDLILESRAWRERLFAERAPRPEGGPSGMSARLAGIVNQAFPGMFGGGMGGLALNQLLVVMDGIDNPPFLRRTLTSRFNTFLDATYILPRRLGKVSLRLRAPGPRKEQIYFIGATNVPIERLDPALIRPGRMGRHVWFRTPTKQDRLDILDLYVGKVSHAQDLDSGKRREEIARVTNGYSPAMIEQVTSMALTIAHHSGRDYFTWEDLVEAMTTVEAGTAIGVEYIAAETRAVSIHEAGHAVCGHVHMKGAQSTRLSIRMRGGSLGHHQALEKEERFSRFQSEEFARLVWGLGAMAAERVFYGESSNGVGGDVFSVTAQAALMVGASAMGPPAIELKPPGPRAKKDGAGEERDKIAKRFEQIGLQIMNRASGGGPFSENPIASVLGDRDKRSMAAQILGQAYVAAYNLVEHNREAVERIADVLAERKELFGDELIELLEAQQLELPDVDYREERAWPTM
ncbi:MAG: AAA family ATPase [Actinobacteria bacterium]|nr:AAA family ATPase [Actinomycetota bacterium]